MRQDTQDTQQVIVRPRDVEKRYGIRKTTLWKLVKEGKIKPPIRLSERCVGFLESDLQDFIAQRLAASRG